MCGQEFLFVCFGGFFGGAFFIITGGIAAYLYVMATIQLYTGEEESSENWWREGPEWEKEKG